MRPVTALAFCATLIIAFQGVSCRTVSSKIPINVGGLDGWSSSVTPWMKNETFHLNDRLGFVYDIKDQDLLEVNNTSYETCNAKDLIHNYTTNGREIVMLNVTYDRYFISSKGCKDGVKLAVHLSLPSKSHRMIALTSQLIIPALVAILVR